MIIPTSDRFVICSRASLIDDHSGPLRAWIERYVRNDPDLRWIVGNYVEADEPNSNGHTFPTAELMTAQATLAGKPLNMLHREHYIVGYFAGAQLLHANGMAFEHDDGNLAAASERPYVEAVAALWHQRFPEEFFQIRRAHAEGTLFFSMEAVPEEVSCPTCARQVPFAGLESATYCAHMQGATGPKVLHRPTFNGGAIIMPPVGLGWSRADVTAIAELVTAPAAEAVYAQVAVEAPELDPTQWEQTMAQLIAFANQRSPVPSFEPPPAGPQYTAGGNVTVTIEKPVKPVLTTREFSTEKRSKLADKGKAMPDGSFPIENAKDLRNAIQAIGRAKNPGAAKAHIKKRAKALGLDRLIPAGW